MRIRRLSLEEVRRKHPFCAVEVRYREVDATYPGHEIIPVAAAPAVLVWADAAASLGDEDGANCVAIYWLREED